MQRYGVTYYPGRAVALFDIVGFSNLTACECLAQRNSLAYSCNAAQRKFTQRSSRFDFSSSTTCDDFYLLSRDAGHMSNIDLYNYAQLISADNAVSRQKSKHRIDGAPLLMAAFHIASYDELYHFENIHPSASNYIVGDVTIELARIIERRCHGRYSSATLALLATPAKRAPLRTRCGLSSTSNHARPSCAD
jgi:hypothetical protein